MNHKIFALGAGLLIMTAWSCREESDALLSYDYNESLVFSDADDSFAAKFRIMWNGMNQNYAIWDFEAENGVDWDAIYDEYYPQFAALDQRAKNDTVTDEELTELLSKCLKPLHDGHFQIEMTNHKTGTTVTYMPNRERNATRDDYELAQRFQPTLAYYANVANGEIETDEDGNPIAIEYSTAPITLLLRFLQMPGSGSQWAMAKIQELEALPTPTEMQAFQLQQLKNLRDEMPKFTGLSVEQAITIYNNLQTKYSFLDIPGFDPIDPAFIENGIGFKFALLKGNIAYFHVNSFAMTSYLNENYCQKTFNLQNPVTRNHVLRMWQVWMSWFKCIQTLHKNGTLGGVIIDVRSNGGGNTNDSQYCVGALLPSGGLQYGYQRYKRGTGRYDYSPMMPGIALTMSDPHETISEPVVILTNCMSASMSEMSTLAVKTMPNGTVIGKRTWGGLCSLVGNELNTYNYSGFFGVQGVTAVYGYVPMLAAYTLDKKLIEGQGISPDIEVDLDETLFHATGKDTQLDRALQFIRTGK